MTSLASETIYMPLDSALAHYISFADGSSTLPYSQLISKYSGIKAWPKAHILEIFQFQYSDFEGESLKCLTCHQDVERDQACVCKGCLTIYHYVCCHSIAGIEQSCQFCLKAVLFSKRDIKTHSEKLREKVPKRKEKPLLQTCMHNNDSEEISSSDSSDSDIENDTHENNSENNNLKFSVERFLTAEPGTLTAAERRAMKDQMYQAQLHQNFQTLNNNLPPLNNFSQWNSFYKAYMETKDKFSDSQNVERLKNAIKCAVVKSWGRDRLFELETYDNRIQYINKTYNHPAVILRAELEKLINRKRIVSHERKRLAEFINDVDDFCILQNKKGTAASRSDETMIRSILNVLPKEMGESFVNYTYNKGKSMTIDNLNKYLQRKMYGIIYNNSEILEINGSASASVAANTGENTKKRTNASNFNAHLEGNHINCAVCGDKNHTVIHCKKAWKLSGSDVMKKIKEKKLCCVCGQEPYSGPSHSCSKRSNRVCDKAQHKGKKHYEILCGLRPASNPQYNNNGGTEETENNNDSRPPHRNFNNRGRGRGRGGFRGHGRNNGGRPYNNQNDENANAYLNQNAQNNVNANNPNEPSTSANGNQIAQNNARQQMAHSNNHNNNNNNNNNQRNNRGQSNNWNQGGTYLTFTGSFHRMNKVENDCWQTSKTLLPVIILKLGPKRIPVSFLLDSGSSISMIETYVADDLKNQGQDCPVILTWSGDVSHYNRSDPNSRVVKFEAEAFNHNKNRRTVHFHTFKDLAIGSQKFVADEVQSRCQYLRNLHLMDYQNIHGVIGQDQANLFKVYAHAGPIDNNEDGYLGFKSPMGDYVSGTRQSIQTLFHSLEQDKVNVNNNFTFTNCIFKGNVDAIEACDAIDSFNAITHSNENLIDDNEMKILEEHLMGTEYFEEMPTNDRVSADDLYALTVIEQEMFIDNSGRFVAPLIFKEENPQLPAYESYCAALKRWFALEATLIKHNKFEEVNHEITKMIDKGYCEKVPPSELKSYDMTFYMPIFCISPPNKRTRLIWDGRAEVKSGVSLNSFLLPGPSLYNKILKIFMNMRSDEVLIVGDLEEMFHQIVIKPEHRNVLRFLWSEKLGQRPQVYRMTRLVFGLNCAPFIAQSAVKLTAKAIELDKPEIANILNNDIYMDDIVTSIKNPEIAQDIIINLKSSLSAAGFNLVKLKSSHPQVFDKLKTVLSDRELQHEKLFPEGNIHRVLGYINDFETDTISLGLTLDKYAKFLIEGVWPSKRDVLSVCMSIYDPLGQFTFLTSKFKFIYHKLCLESMKWDDQIPGEIYNLWKQALSWISDCCKLKIPRCYAIDIKNDEIKQLWAFSDASDHAECVVIYLRRVNKERDQLSVSLIISKNFVVPKNIKRTIPELELDAATKAVMLIKDVINLHEKFNFHELFLATDNSTVFSWLLNGLEKPSVYVKNRLTNINKAELKIIYKWVPTDFQPADFGTKFSAMPQIELYNDWFYPKMFRLPESDWISDQFLRRDVNKSMVTFNNIRTAKIPINLTRFSSLNKLIGVLRRITFRWLLNVRKLRLQKSREQNKFKFEVEKSITKI